MPIRAFACIKSGLLYFEFGGKCSNISFISAQGVCPLQLCGHPRGGGGWSHLPQRHQHLPGADPAAHTHTPPHPHMCFDPQHTSLDSFHILSPNHKDSDAQWLVRNHLNFP